MFKQVLLVSLVVFSCNASADYPADVTCSRPSLDAAFGGGQLNVTAYRTVSADCGYDECFIVIADGRRRTGPFRYLRTLVESFGRGTIDASGVHITFNIEQPVESIGSYELRVTPEGHGLLVNPDSTTVRLGCQVRQ